MQIISSYYYPREGIGVDEYLKMMRSVGFTGCALDYEEDMTGFYDVPREKQPALAEKNGLIIDQAHLTIVGVGDIWYDDIRGEAIETRQIRELRECASYGVGVAVMHMSYGMEAGPLSRCGLERMKRITAAAEKYGIKLALENSRNIPHLNYTLDGISSPYLGFCYDSGHENEFTNDTDYLSKYGGRLMAMHLNDNNGSDDLHILPYDGNIDWKQIKKRIGGSELMRKTITLEASGRYSFHPYSNLNAEEINGRTSGLSIFGNEKLLLTDDGRCSFYNGLSDLEFLERAFLSAVRFIDEK